MPIDFPNSPTNGQTFTVGEKVWIYQDGKWQGGNGPVGPAGATGPTGPQGPAGPNGSIDLLSDVIITNPANNDVLSYNGSAFVNTQLANIGGAGNAVTTISTSAPASPSEGNLWFESDTGRTYIYYDSYWVEVGAVSTGEVNSSNMDGGQANSVYGGVAGITGGSA